MNKLRKNDNAISFTVYDYQGNKINLSDYKGGKIILSFFRGASCPFCNLRVNQLINQHAEFERKGIQIIVFFAATKAEISQYAGQQKAPFPIIPDPDLEVYKKYGIEESSLGMFKAMINPFKMMKVIFAGFFNMRSISDRPIVPADFLIDKDQIIYRVHHGKDFGDHIPLRDLLLWEE
jgi:peroxiredoxin